MEIKRNFFTSDLCLATILKTKGFMMTGFETMFAPGGGKRMKFFFELNEEIYEMVKKYQTGDPVVNSYKIFFNNLKELKSIIYTSNSGVE